MTRESSDVTRFLCASALLNGERFRTSILARLKEKNRAAAPEPGLDLKLVAQVCADMKRRETRYDAYFLLALLAGLFLVPFLGGATALIAFVVATAAIYFHKEYKTRYELSEYFSRDKFDPEVVEREFPGELDREIEGSLPPADQNVVVYHNFLPFVGAGVDLGGWSFTVDISKPKSDSPRAAPREFTASELYGALDESLNSLGLSNLSTRDYLFVRGVDIRARKEFLKSIYSRPASRVDSSVLDQYIARSDSTVRHYKWIRIESWEEELIYSFFIRAALMGPTMFVECKRFILTPLGQQFRSIDGLAPVNGAARVGLAMTGVLQGPFVAIGAAARLWSRLVESIQSTSRNTEEERRRQILNNPLFNYGVGNSLRESFASGLYLHYFQQLDGDFYTKLLDRDVLDAICCFLDDHDVDTSDLRDRETTILNSGIIVQGGNVKAEALAVGAGAQAVKAPKSLLGRRHEERTTVS